MEEILNFLRSDVFLIALVVIVFIIFILYIINVIKLAKMRKSNKEFMEKLGNGTNLEEMLKKYIQTVEKVEKENKNLADYCKKLDNHMGKCLQKVGMVRYNAFRDTGSDLSFTLAILDEGNNGVVLNGIYSREMSNIYAKSVEKGESPYTLSDEEQEAIKIAVNRE